LAALAAGVLGLGLSIWVFLLSPEPDAVWTDVGTKEGGGAERLDKWRAISPGGSISKRETSDATNFREEWLLGEMTPEIQDAARDAERELVKLTPGEPAWAGYYNAIADPFFVGDIVEVCGPQYTGSEACYVGLNIVTAPHEGESGPRSVVKFAEVSSANPSTPECRKYTSCVARGFLGRELPPVPGGGGHEGTLMKWGMPAWDDERIQVNREKIEACIELCTTQLQELADGLLPAEDAHLFEYHQQRFGDRKAWCEHLLSEL
jgi:hypothetical protein